MSAMSNLLEHNIDFSQWTPEAAAGEPVLPAEDCTTLDPVAEPQRSAAATPHPIGADEWLERTRLGYRNWQQVVRSQHRFHQIT